MTSSVEYYSDTIVIRSRGFLEYLTFGNWGRIYTLDFSRKTLEATTIRPFKSTVKVYELRSFDAVDYSYKLLGTACKNGVCYDHEEFRVGLRLATTGFLFPLAVFQGVLTTPYGFGAIVAHFLPESWLVQSVIYEVQARVLANTICDKLQLKLAM